MHKEYYGFSEEPFALDPDPRFFFPTEPLNGILELLIQEITERKRFILVTGGTGTGKTTLIHQLLGRLDPKIRAVPIYQPCKTFEELLGIILRELKVPFGKETKGFMVSQLNEYVLQRSALDETLLIIVDEAQTLSTEAMEDLRLLSNSDPRRPKFLQELFIGDPEIQNRLKSRDLRQLQQRIAVRCQIPPLTHSESVRYIEYRLSRVGRRLTDVFTPKAVDLIGRHGQGVPRVINMLSYLTLSAGYTLSRKKIDAPAVKEVCSILERLKPSLRQRLEISLDAAFDRFESSPLSMRISYALLAYSILQWIVFYLLTLERT
jgi:general secretion pathway protein A